jgi:hypothetical protein
MSDAGLTRRVLGLSVPVTEVLDPVAWRERYAYGISLGPSRASGSSPSSIAQLLCKSGKATSLTEARAQLEKAQEKTNSLVDSLPDEVIRWHLRAALSELEVKLGMPMGVVVYKSTPVDDGLVEGVHYDRLYPRKPFLRSAAREYYKIDLPNNVISIERVRAFYFGDLAWEISAERDNLDLVKLEWPKAASAHLLPTLSTNILLTAPGIAGGNYGGWALMFGGLAKVPDVWAIDFTVGPRDQYGKVAQIEAVLAHWVYCVAGITLLSMGSLARSAGISSTSISMDGLSRSVALQASAIYSLSSSLEQRLKEATERISWEKLRTYKRGIRIRPYGH